VTRTAAKANVSDINVMKSTDKTSTKLAEAAPSGRASCASVQH